MAGASYVRRYPRRRILVWTAFWICMLLLSSLIISLAGVIFVGTAVGLGVSSQDWGGYTVTSSILNPQPLVTAVSGSWVVPEVATSQNHTFSAVWVGLGGQFDKTLIQIGTEQDSIDGSSYYLAWYELLPAYSVTIDSLKISAGDVINASISLIDSQRNGWLMTLMDLSSGQRFELSTTYNSSRLSADWIVERPRINDTIASLAPFGQVAFTDITATVGNSMRGLQSFSFVRVSMRDSQNKPLVSVSTFSGQTKDRFNVTFLNSD